MANSALDFTFAAPGQWKLISSQTAANSATIDFTGLSSVYSTLMLVIDNIVMGTNTDYLAFRVSTDNGATYLSSNYYYCNLYNVGGTTTTASVGSATSCYTSHSLSNASPTSISLTLFGPARAGYMRGCFIATGGQSSGALAWSSGAFTNTTTTAINAIRLLGSSGLIASGTFTLYGLEA